MIRCNRICRECMVFGLLYPADDSKWVARRGDNGRVFGGYLHSAPPINNNYNQNGNTANLIFTARECTAAVHACMQIGPCRHYNILPLPRCVLCVELQQDRIVHSNSDYFITLVDAASASQPLDYARNSGSIASSSRYG